MVTFYISVLRKFDKCICKIETNCLTQSPVVLDTTLCITASFRNYLIYLTVNET